jgi:WD40 repeat protein
MRRSVVMPTPVLFLCLFVFFVAIASSSARGAEPTYWRDVRPILRKSCTVCHNQRQLAETEISGGLTLDSYEAVLRWKEKNRPLVHPGKSATSLLYQVVVTTDGDKRMPLGAKPLPEETIAVLKRWIDSGAKEGTKPDSATIAPPPSTTVVRRRKLDVTLPTTTTPDTSAFLGAPRGALTLSLKVGPLSPVVALAYHPTQPWLAAGAYGRVTVWDTKTGKPIRVLTSVLGAVNDLRFSPDGKLLAVAGGQPSAKGDLRLITVADWKLKSVLAGHDDVVASVSFRPDGAKIASASYDRTVRVWDVVSGKSERVLTMHSDFVTGVAYSPDGKSLASASKDRSVRLVEADTGAGKLTFSDRNEDVLAVAFTADGKAVVSTGLEPNLSWWNAATGERLRTVGGHRGSVHELALSKDGKLLASAGADGTVKLWNGSTGAMVRSIAAGSLMYSAALNPDAKVVAAGGFDGLVRLFDTSTGQPRGTLLSLPSGEWLAMTPAGYAAGSDELLSQARWTIAGKPLPADAVWKSLRSPDNVVKALRGESVPAPAFGK